MGTKDIMTMQEVQEMKQQLEQVFSIVRLLDGETLETGEGIEPPCQCYSIWGKDERCTNCISRKALKEKRQKTKIEIVDSKVYQVISKYLNIDGKPYIMEMINNLEDDDIIDSEDRENLLAELSGYADKLYKDALTGVLIEDIMRIRSEIWRVLPAWLWWIWMILNFITIPMDMMQVIKH